MTNLSHGLQYPPHQPSYHSCPCLFKYLQAVSTNAKLRHCILLPDREKQCYIPTSSTSIHTQELPGNSTISIIIMSQTKPLFDLQLALQLHSIRFNYFQLKKVYWWHSMYLHQLPGLSLEPHSSLLQCSHALTMHTLSLWFCHFGSHLWIGTSI